MRARGAIIVALLAINLIAAAACGDDDDSDAPSQTPTSAPAVTRSAAPTRSPTSTPAPPAQPPGPEPVIEHPAILSPAELFIADAAGTYSHLRLRSAGVLDMAWSPTGNSLAVAIQDYNQEVGKILVLSADGSEPPAVSATGGIPTQIVWSPDSQLIAAVVGDAQGDSLLVLEPGGEPVVLDHSPRSGGEPTFTHISGWLPDGRLLAAIGAPFQAPLYAYDVRSTQKVGFNDIVIGSPADVVVSPDGAQVAFAAASQQDDCVGGGDTVWVMSVSGANRRSFPVAAGACQTFTPAWSPGGDRLAYGVFGHQASNGLYVLDLATGDTSKLSDSMDAPVVWLDNDRVAVERHGCYGCEGVPSALVVSTDGSVAQLAAQLHHAWTTDGSTVARSEEDGVHVTTVADDTDRLIVPAEAGWAVSNLAWSSDASSVAYVRYHGIGVRTYEIGADGSGLTQTGLYDESEEPSPDGTRVTWIEYDEGRIAALYIADVDGTNRSAVDLYVESFNGARIWAPNSSRLVVGGTFDLENGPMMWWLVDRQGNVIKDLPSISGGYESPVWSPDGRFIAACSGTGSQVIEVSTGETWTVAGCASQIQWSDSETLALAGGDLFVVRYDGSGYRNVASSQHIDTGIAVSPDGRRAVISRIIDNTTPDSVIVDVATGEAIRGIPALRADLAAWSPDGEKIAMVGWAPASSGLFIVDADTGRATQIAWGAEPNNIHWLDNDTIAFDKYQGGL